jgi:site-specific DNA-cytosine methylase
MKVLDLFCGTKSISNAFAARGHTVFTVDWDKQFQPTIAVDIGTLTATDIINICGGVPDVIWASPDCTTYSVAAISRHRRREPNGSLSPVSDYAKQCDETNKRVIALIKELNPRYWFIENPRGGMRKMDFMQGLPRYTVTYCKYGDMRMKPTDIWTNHPAPNFIPACKNGDTCHEPAPRGSRTGTQGLQNKIEKARIPCALCEHIVDICEVV